MLFCKIRLTIAKVSLAKAKLSLIKALSEAESKRGLFYLVGTVYADAFSDIRCYPENNLEDFSFEFKDCAQAFDGRRFDL